MKTGRLRIAFTFVIVFFSSILSAETIRIGLFRNSPVKSFMITASSGEYCVLGDSLKLMNLKHDDPVKVFLDTGWISIATMEGIVGTFRQISFSCTDSLSNIRIKGLVPSTKEKQVNGDLLFVPESNGVRLINIINLDEYISGVVESEAGHGHSSEFYRVQAIISRTYALSNSHKHEMEGFHLCDQVHCQAYKGMCKKNRVIHEAATDTKGIVLVDDSLKLITAAFHSNCGGQTANSEQVWLRPLPYLRSVKDSYCISQPNAFWKKEISLPAWISYLKKYQFPVEDTVCLNYCLSVKQPYRMTALSSCNKWLPYKNIRSDLKLKSAFFSVEKINEYTLVLKGRGFGHGVGLCQEGAMKMAKLGFDYKTILRHYFTGIHIIDRLELAAFLDK